MLFIRKSSMLEIWLRSEFCVADNNDYVQYEIRFRLIVDMMFQSV